MGLVGAGCCQALHLVSALCLDPGSVELMIWAPFLSSSFETRAANAPAADWVLSVQILPGRPTQVLPRAAQEERQFLSGTLQGPARLSLGRAFPASEETRESVMH